MDLKTIMSVFFLLLYSGPALSKGYMFRLEGRVSRCEGRLELSYQGEWKGVRRSSWTGAEFLCKHLGCGSYVSSRHVGEDRPVWKVTSRCTGAEADLNTCVSVIGGFTDTALKLTCSELRLVNGSGPCSGRLEVKSQSRLEVKSQSWVSVCEDDFDERDAEVVCRDLGCGPLLVLQGALYGGQKGPFWSKEFRCSGSESHLLDCRTSDSKRNTYSPGNAVGLTCSSYDVRLEGGVTGRCEGRLELSQQREWRPVAWWMWTQETSRVLCKHLDCGYYVSTKETDGELRALWKVGSNCTGAEDDLNTCVSAGGEWPDIRVLEVTCSGTLPTTPPTSSPRLVCLNGGQLQSGGCICPGPWTGVTCSIGVRLEGGVSRCEGRLELYQAREWRRMTYWSATRKGVFWSWTQATYSLLCKHLDCGSHVSRRWTPVGELDPLWWVSSTCTGAEADLNTCLSVDGDATATGSTTALEVTCSESVRLVNGSGPRCSGRLEVKSQSRFQVKSQSWVSVCEDDFDRRDAEVVCRELGCGPPLVLQGALYGGEKGPFWSKEFRCSGSESHLLDCTTSDSKRNTYSPGNAVGLTCSSFDVRLKGGVSRCEGRPELYQEREWRGLTRWLRSQKESSLLCKHLDCGSYVSERETPGEVHLVWFVSSTCTGAEADLNTCLSVDGGSSMYGEHAATTALEVTCSAKPSEFKFSQCGIRQPGTSDRIKGGTSGALPGDHPWQASLQGKENDSNDPFVHFCGGVLIESCWVLTAAHCIKAGVDLRVQLGSVDIEEDEEDDQTIDVEKVIVHEKYKRSTEGNDIALLKLKSVNGRCANETHYVKTACLPSRPRFLANTTCVISGWGKTETNNGSRHLLYAHVPIISQKICMDFHWRKIKYSMLCAGKTNGGADACQGDSGGPLMCEKNGTHYVTGLVSWGPDKCNGGGVYTNVALFVNWITNQTSNML